MQQRTTRVNPSEETIKIGPLGIRFLLTGDDPAAASRCSRFSSRSDRSWRHLPTRTLPTRRFSPVSRASLPGQLMARIPALFAVAG
jgi:hypothetical protein